MFQFKPLQKNQVDPKIITKTFDESEVIKLNQIINSLPYHEATTHAGGEDLSNDSKIRKSNVKWIQPDPNNSWLFEKIEEILIHVNNEQYNFDLYNMPTVIQYTEYEDNVKGHYTWHIDLGPIDPLCYRKLSVTILLSDPNEVEGGDLEFFIGGSNPDVANLKQYDMVIFPSYLLHRVTPVTKGIRKSLVIWVGGSTFK